MSLMAPLAFCTDFDRALADGGVPGLFTLSPDGELRLAPDRTREAWDRLEGPPRRAEAHALLRDRATSFVQYVLSTSPDLLIGHPRAEVAFYPCQADALAALAGLGRPPLCEGEDFPPGLPVAG